MIWISSFPRSGNTFLRNILFECYGLASSTFHLESDYPLDAGFDTFPFVKTHELPNTLDDEFEPDIPAIYLVRDGRDTICSMAHHRSNLIAPGSDLHKNMLEAIIAERGSFFDGWSRHVEAWMERADIIIRYEDLVRDPLGCTERIRQLRDLPTPDSDRLPTFKKLKHGIPEYGAGRHQPLTEEQKLHQAKLFFRRGQAGAWKDEMPESVHELFWSYHGEAMERMGYSRSGQLQPPHRDLDAYLIDKLGMEKASNPDKPYRVLIEANKLVSNDNDGIKRYQVELLKAMFPVIRQPGSRWHIDLLFHGRIQPLRDLHQLLTQSFSRDNVDARVVLPDMPEGVDETLEGDESPEPGDQPQDETQRVREQLPNLFLQPSFFLRVERLLVRMVPRSFVGLLHKHKFTLFHDSYEAVRAGLIGLNRFAFRLVEPQLTWREKRKAKRMEAAEKKEQESAAGKREIESTPASEADAPYHLVHIPLKQNFKPFVGSNVTKLITFHDLTHENFPQFHTEVNINNAREGVRFAEETEANIIAVSESTRQDTIKYTNLPAERIHRIYEAADPRLFHKKTNREDCLSVRGKYGISLEHPYLICLSTLEPRKNLINTIRAFVLLKKDDPFLRLKLVIAGKKGWDSDPIYAPAKDLLKDIVFTGFVDDDDLPYLYSDALALSYLSFYEGFGLPVLEAMRCGTPVIFGNNSSLVEIVEKGGLPVDPTSIEDIKSQYLRLIKSPELRERLSQFALARANDFSWRKAAVQTLALYEELIEQDAQNERPSP